MGTYAVQIAKALGAEVTGVCSTGKMEMVRSIGADHVIDYTQEDFTQNGQQYDLILAANGFQPLSAYERALSPQGIYVMSGGATAQMFQAMLLGPLKSKKGGKKMGNLLVKPTQAGSALPQRTARSRQSCACDRQTIPVEPGARRHPLSGSRPRQGKSGDFSGPAQRIDIDE